jgi:hypothetical protein
MAVFWVAAPFPNISDVPIPVIALMIEVTSASETSLNFYQTTWRNKPEDSQPHTR